MSAVRNTRRVLGVAFCLGVAVGLGSCALSETDAPSQNPEGEGASGTSGRAGSAGASNAGATQGKSGASGAGGLGTGGSAGGTTSVGGSSATGGSSGSTAGTLNGGAAGTGGSTSTGGMSTGGTDASGGTGSDSSCTDLPPNNGQGCENAVEYGWCEMEWLGDSCQRTCGKCTGGGSGGSSGSNGSGGSSGSGGSGTAGTGSNGNVQPPPNISGGQNAWASRYWDCCKPACGWSANAGGTPMKSCNQQNQTLGDNDARNACESGGSAFMCWNGAPWQVGENLSYGFAAASGPNYQCGRCFHVQFNGTGHNGSNPGAQSLNGKHMIVQVINNGGVAQDQFDLLIPGGGVGLLNACTQQWGTSDLGAQYGGFLTGCNGDKNCVRTKCETIFADKPDLMEGCEWFLGWYNAADNPNFVYERIACPAEITQRSGLQDR